MVAGWGACKTTELSKTSLLKGTPDSDSSCSRDGTAPDCAGKTTNRRPNQRKRLQGLAWRREPFFKENCPMQQCNEYIRNPCLPSSHFNPDFCFMETIKDLLKSFPLTP